jgi:hypothetical protein
MDLARIAAVSECCRSEESASGANAAYGGSREKVTASEITKPAGLCGNCGYASKCSFQRDFRRPVLHCEEYEVLGAPPTQPRMDGITPQLGLTPEDDPGGGNLGDCRGLCQDCAVRSTCTYPRAPGGVWHCAEYE